MFPDRLLLHALPSVFAVDLRRVQPSQRKHFRKPLLVRLNLFSPPTYLWKQILPLQPVVSPLTSGHPYWNSPLYPKVKYSRPCRWRARDPDRRSQYRRPSRLRLLSRYLFSRGNPPATQADWLLACRIGTRLP